MGAMKDLIIEHIENNRQELEDSFVDANQMDVLDSCETKEQYINNHEDEFFEFGMEDYNNSQPEE